MQNSLFFSLLAGNLTAETGWCPWRTPYAVRPPSALETLRAQVWQIEGGHRRATTVPFGAFVLDKVTTRSVGGVSVTAAVPSYLTAFSTMLETARRIVVVRQVSARRAIPRSH